MPMPRLFRPLDFVQHTPTGHVGMITETDPIGSQASVSWLTPNAVYQKVAWWSDGEHLVVISSLPHLLATNMAHPFGRGHGAAVEVFPR